MHCSGPSQCLRSVCLCFFPSINLSEWLAILKESTLCFQSEHLSSPLHPAGWDKGNYSVAPLILKYLRCVYLNTIHKMNLACMLSLYLYPLHCISDKVSISCVSISLRLPSLPLLFPIPPSLLLTSIPWRGAILLMHHHP